MHRILTLLALQNAALKWEQIEQSLEDTKNELKLQPDIDFEAEGRLRAEKKDQDETRKAVSKLAAKKERYDAILQETKVIFCVLLQRNHSISKQG